MNTLYIFVNYTAGNLKLSCVIDNEYSVIRKI